MKKNGYCEHCGAPIATKPGRGRPRQHCSAACRKAAQRRRDAQRKRPAPQYTCEHCGARMDADRRWCSDRCEFYGRKGILPGGKELLAAYNETRIPVRPGVYRPWKPWYLPVYAGRGG